MSGPENGTNPSSDLFDVACAGLLEHGRYIDDAHYLKGATIDGVSYQMSDYHTYLITPSLVADPGEQTRLLRDRRSMISIEVPLDKESWFHTFRPNDMRRGGVMSNYFLRHVPLELINDDPIVLSAEGENSELAVIYNPLSNSLLRAVYDHIKSLG